MIDHALTDPGDLRREITHPRGNDAKNYDAENDAHIYIIYIYTYIYSGVCTHSSIAIHIHMCDTCK